MLSGRGIAQHCLCLGLVAKGMVAGNARARMKMPRRYDAGQRIRAHDGRSRALLSLAGAVRFAVGDVFGW